MKKFFKKLKVFFNRILLGILLAVAVAVTFYLFPHLGSFPYEYQQGSPWMHENLIADFDFPILKSEEEVSRERDSILGAFRPYFTVNEDVGSKKIDEFRRIFPSVWSQFVEDNVLDTIYSSDQIKDIGEKYAGFAAIRLDSLYSGGILPQGIEDNEEDIDVSEGINILLNKVSRLRMPGQVANPLESYRRLQSEMTDTSRFTVLGAGLLEELFIAAGFNRFLASNLVYDKETTESLRESLLDEVNLTRGMVQDGQRVISRGDMITHDKYLTLKSYRVEYEKQMGDINTFPLIRVGQLLLIIILLGSLVLYLYQFQKPIIGSNLKMTFILILVLLSILGGSMIGKWGSFTVYLVPFIIVPVVLRAFFNSRTSIFIHVITMMLVGFLVPNSFEFFIMQFVAGYAAIISFAHLQRRGQLVVTIGLVFAAYSVVFIAFSIMQEGNFKSIEWINIAWLAGNSLLILLSYPLVYIFEKLFGFVSDVTMIELSDSNHPLLRKMAEEAPGSFQHSIQVANLAESVIRVIGGNPLLVRTGAMYHDIGKMENSIFFTENQVSGVNPHDQLDRKKSAEIIISHVTRGGEIAKKHKLPKPIIDFIYTHHGTSKTVYFYRMYQKENPDENVDPLCFTYPGPRPYSKETAVLMMADSVEAASRSLDEYNEESVRRLVNSIIDAQFADKQFNEAEITLAEISKAREILISKLINIYHPRIQYPK